MLLDKIINLLDIFVWRLVDSQRKPDVDMVIDLDRNACLSRLTGIRRQRDTYKFELAGTAMGYVYSGWVSILGDRETYFHRWPNLILSNSYPTSLGLHGRITSDGQSTHIKLWYRMSAIRAIVIIIFVYTIVLLIGAGAYALGLASSQWSTIGFSFLPFIMLVVFLPFLTYLLLVVSRRCNKPLRQELINFVIEAVEIDPGDTSTML